MRGFNYENASGSFVSVNNDLGLTITATYDAQDRLVTYGGATYTYSANGELSARTQASGTTNYEYDEMGNLVRVGLEDGRVINYIVDGLNRRVGKKVNGTLTKVFLWESQLRITAEMDASNNVVSRFVYGDKPNVPEYMIKGGVTYQLVTDHLGSVRLVVDSSTGAVAQRIDYDEYGIVEGDTNPGFQPFGFAGGLYDADTKLVRFGVRDYDAEVGRWISKDPIRFKGGDTNLYSYVISDPINHIDPEGKWWGYVPLCLYYTWKLKKAVKKCDEEFKKFCENDPDGLGPERWQEEKYGVHDMYLAMRKCWEEKDPETYNKFVKYCSKSTP